MYLHVLSSTLNRQEKDSEKFLIAKNLMLSHLMRFELFPRSLESEQTKDL